MTTQLSAKQQEQINNRDQLGQFATKTHSDVEDTSAVLGVGERPLAAPAREPAQIDALDESAVDLSAEETAILRQDPPQRASHHRAAAEALEAEYFPEDQDIAERKFHRAAQWAYEADHRASFAAEETTDYGQTRLVQYNRHGQALRSLDGTPRTVGGYEGATLAAIPEEFKTDEGHFDLKKARAASDDHLETTAKPAIAARTEEERVAYAKSAHRASPSMRLSATGSGRDLAADEAEAIDQATRAVPTTSLRERGYDHLGEVEHAKPAEARERAFDRQQARNEAAFARDPFNKR